VALQDWCDWTGTDWDKIRAAIGRAYRLPGPGQDLYTMAATAVLRLIEAYDVDGSSVRFLALGTESSTDNSAGAIIVKGMVNDGLTAVGRPALSRHCEVPELKHACLGGIYGLKNALRFLATDGGGARAIVVCADQAIYPLGSSGEPTQGAGAVALLLDARPAIATIDLTRAGTASDDRRLDFRKPSRASRSCDDGAGVPVYNGRYSTNCYIDEMLRALEDMYARSRTPPVTCLRRFTAVFLHRPYRRMPETAWGIAWLAALAGSGRAAQTELGRLCRTARVPIARVIAELRNHHDLAKLAVPDRVRESVFPATLTVLNRCRATGDFQQRIVAALRLGEHVAAELGNLYTAALPAWLAAGLEEAACSGIRLAGRDVLLVGYGSGDAAEALPIRVVPGWERAAKRIALEKALKSRVEVTRRQYLALRSGKRAAGLNHRPAHEFVISRVGRKRGAGFQDSGIAYYRFVR
jgi:hydroxymethylglutaryl-CoA synthase